MALLLYRTCVRLVKWPGLGDVRPSSRTRTHPRGRLPSISTHTPPNTRPRADSRWRRTAAAGAYARLVERHAAWVLVGVLVVTAALAPGLGKLHFSSSNDTIIPSTSPVYRDNVNYQREFGGDPMLVLFTGDVRRLFTPQNRRELTRLEHALVRDGRYHALISPLTVLRNAIAEIPIAPRLQLGALARDQDAAAAKARARTAARGATAADQDAADAAARARLATAFARRTGADATRLAAAGEQSLANPAFVDFLIFDERGRVRPSLVGIFLDRNHALFLARLAGNLSINQTADAAQRVVDLTKARRFRGIRTLATGSLLLVKEINDGMQGDMGRMGALALAVMAAVLLLVLRFRHRLLALPVTLVGIAWAFGILGYLGVPLTMVTISGFPILIGLGVDFAVQVHARYEEEAAVGDGSAASLALVLDTIGRALTVALGAALVGFLALRISEVPMVRDFGVMLGVGTITLFVVSMTAVPAALVAWEHRMSCRPARPIVAAGAVERAVRGLTGALAHGTALSIVGVVVVLTVGGAFALDRTKVVSDPERFVPQDSAVLGDLRHIRAIARSSGDLGLMVESDDVLSADVLTWIDRFETTELRRHPDELFGVNSVASATRDATGSTPIPDDVRAVFAAAPRAISKTLLSADGHRTNIIFAIGEVTLDRRKAITNEMLGDLHGALRPPNGLRVTPSGLAIIGIATLDALSANRWEMAIAALVAVLLWLLLAFRQPIAGLLAIAPVLAALGGAWIAIYLLGVQVNSLGALSSPLVVAVCTEFGVLVVTRYREERSNGASPEAAIATAATRIGRAFVASGLATAGGFGVLALSGFPLISSFGVVIALNVLAAIAASLMILPPLLLRFDPVPHSWRTTHGGAR